ncbi:MAG: diaminopimelate decarboxylase [Elusimicrobia bacterium]|nr:diaminopimelate decarboxylase [Elusimicrobiota bacterium]
MSQALAYRGGRLFIEAVSAAEIAERFGTPVYAYSRRTLAEAFKAAQAAFSRPGTLICYALKANSNRRICGLLASMGAGAEVVSGGELQRALAAGFKPEKIVFSGVGKTEAELKLALKAGILAVNVESEEELDALESVARKARRRAAFAVRLNPDVDAGTHAHVTTGTAADKFGVQAPEALRMYLRASRSPVLEARSIHCHIGSQVTSVGPYRAAAREVAAFVAELESRGIKLGAVDLGGGMGIAYSDGKAMDLAALARALEVELSCWPDKRLIVEPGRLLTADAGVLLARVLYRKKTTERGFVVVDAGMTDLIRPALYGAEHPIWNERQKGGGGGLVDVVGPVCESADHLGRGVRLGRSKPGDVLAVLRAGAYGFCMSSQYNSRPRPAEVLVDGNTVRLIRRRETVADLVRGEL